MFDQGENGSVQPMEIINVLKTFGHQLAEDDIMNIYKEVD